MKRIAVTGAAGYIGFHFVRVLAGQDCGIVGVGNVQWARLGELEG